MCCSYKDVKTQNYNKDNRRFKDWCAEHRVPADAQALLNDLLALNPANRIKAMEATQVNRRSPRYHKFAYLALLHTHLLYQTCVAWHSTQPLYAAS